jgi:hypothetical protein
MTDLPRSSTGEPIYPFSDLRSTGVLWAINRMVFHPMGLALGLHYPDGVDHDTGEPDGWSLLYDGTEVVAFLDPERPEDPEFEAFWRLIDQRRATPEGGS